jgi:hypothetical protein
MKVKKIGEEQKPVEIHKPEVYSHKEFTQNVLTGKTDLNNKKLYFISGAILLIVISFLLYYFLFYQKSENKTADENTIQNELKKKELDLKEKELQVKEKELQKNSTTQNSNTNPNNVNSGIPGRFPEASSRFLTADDLNSLSKYDLKIMRNEIFARYGYIFQTEDMRNYFNRQTWYTPRYSDVNSFLTKIEKKNIDLIKYFE